MIEKFSSIRWNYNLDEDIWNNEEFLNSIYEKTANSYPIVNFGKLVGYCGLTTTALSLLQPFNNTTFFVQAVCGIAVCGLGYCIMFSNQKQALNYIYNKEAKSKLKKIAKKRNLNQNFYNEKTR